MRRAFFVPGRIEVLGKHTDYAGGRSLLCATERGFRAIANPRADESVTLTDASSGATAAFALDPEQPPMAGHWSAYGIAVARRIARNFPRARRGAAIVFQSDLPRDAGLSSSSALVVAIFLALSAVNDLEQDAAYASAIRSREDLASYLACVENGASYGDFEGDRGVGTSGGSEDHTAILCCAAGQLSMYSFCPVRRERTILLPPEHVFAVAASGVAARKTGAAMGHYNRAAAAAAEILERWRASTGRSGDSLGSVMVHADAAERLRECLRAEPALLARFEQFVEESTAIVPRAADALANGDLGAFGALADRSQRLAERALGNQVPETIALARSAREQGAEAASAFGAGFGGSVWALVRSNDADDFLQRWARAYGAEFPDAAARATFFTTGPGDAAREV